MTASATLPRNSRELVFTSSQAARYLGVSLATVRRWTDAGYVSCYRTPGGQRRFAREQLDEFITSMHRDGPAAVADGEPVTIGLRPEHLRLTSAGEAPGLPCTVEMVEISVSDAAHLLHLRHRDHTFCAKVALPQPVRPRETVWLHFPPQHLYYFDRDDKRL